MTIYVHTSLLCPEYVAQGLKLILWKLIYSSVKMTTYVAHAKWLIFGQYKSQKSSQKICKLLIITYVKQTS